MIATAIGWVTGGSFTRLAATALAGAALGAWAGWELQGWRADHNRVQQVERQARDTLREVERRDTVSTTYLKGQADADQIHTQIIERVRVVNARPAGAVQCLDADGLHLLREAIDSGAPAATAARAGPGLPAVAPPS